MRTLTDDELFNATYTDYKYPSDFYNENLGDTSLYYVNMVSIDTIAEGESIQMATNSYEKALAWSRESTYENSSFTDGQKSENFHEFIRVKNPHDNSPIKFRTHKSTYLTRNNYDLLTHLIQLEFLLKRISPLMMPKNSLNIYGLSKMIKHECKNS